MFERFFRTPAALARHTDAPFAVERARYITYCSERGATPLSLASKWRELLWASRLFDGDPSIGVNIERLHAMAVQRSAGQKGDADRVQERFVNIVRPWLRYLGWWREPVVSVPWQGELEMYCRWMKCERGLADSTIYQWHGSTKRFLIWYGSKGRSLADLQPFDVDLYVAHLGTGGLCRLSIKNVVKALRSFLRYAGDQGWCKGTLAEAVEGPRVYAEESLPMGPAWPDVRRLIKSVDTDRPRDLRDRAILMLLAIYGLRVGEVVKLRLDDLDWEHELLHVRRVKRRKLQTYPMLASVAAAIARYLQEARPRSDYREVFLGIHSPHRPLTQGAVHHVVFTGLNKLGVHTAHFGPHSLRHACAGRLVAERLSLKEIGDHLGHRGVTSTRVYAKVDLAGLREVAAFDLGGLR